MLALGRDNPPSPNNIELGIRIVNVPLKDRERHDRGRRINPKYLRKLGADVSADLERRFVESAIRIDVVAADRHWRICDRAEAAAMRDHDLIGRIGISKIFARLVAIAKEIALRGISSRPAFLIVSEAHTRPPRSNVTMAAPR